MPSAVRRSAATSASFSALGHAQSSPIVSGATVLVRGQEARHAIGVQAGVAVREQVLREGLDARHAQVAGQAGELAIVRRRQVALDVAGLGLDQMEVVQHPLGGGRDGPAFVDVLGDEAIGLAQALDVALEPAQVRRADEAPPHSRLRCRQGTRTLFELLDAQQSFGARVSRLHPPS